MSLKAAIGGTYRRLYSVPIYAWVTGLQVGGSGANVSGYVTFHTLSGETEHGLGVLAMQVGGLAEWHLPGIDSRLGLGGKLGFASIQQVTEDDSFVDGSLTFRVLGNVDLVTFEEVHTLYLELDFEYDLNGMWGPTAVLGYRYW